MEKQISAIRHKMIFVICALLALSVWQHEFIMKGVMAHAQINLTILGTGAFGVISAFVFVARLGNEVIAFRALKEMSDDIRRAQEGGPEEMRRIFARCEEPAQIFTRPKLLGHAYDLVTEELARTKKIRITVETMNTLVHKIESSISDEKSLIVYISGLLVFMGLIGTFIGLLHMVTAIGGIIGSLAKTGDAGAGAFSELLGALEEPLRGMASGFASSLFGLFCSLLVGLMGRFAGQAAGVLKANFEAWLAGVVQLSDDEIAAENATDGPGRSVSGAAVADAAMLKLVTGLLGDYGKVAGAFADATKTLKAIRSAQDTQIDLIGRVAEAIAQANASQGQMLEALKAQAPLMERMDEFGRGMHRWLERVRAQREDDAARAERMFEVLARRHNEDMRLASLREVESAGQIVAAIGELTVKFEGASSASTTQTMEAAIARVFARAQREGAEDLNLAMAGVAREIERGFAQTRSADEARMSSIMVALQFRDTNAKGAGTQALEAVLGDGLDRIGQSVEAALGAYSSLARVALAALERTQANAAAATDDDATDVAGAA